MSKKTVLNIIKKHGFCSQVSFTGGLRVSDPSAEFGLFGKNAAEDSSISPFVGSWVSVLIIGVFALYLTKQASSDRGLANLDRIQVPLIRFVEKIKKIKSFKELYSHVKR